jgi:hypothetical protein
MPKAAREMVMPVNSNPVFHDVKREMVPTDVDFFVVDQDIAERPQESELDRAARLEVIHSLVAQREVLLSERAALTAERSTLRVERDDLLVERNNLAAERTTAIVLAIRVERAIRRFIRQWMPAPVKRTARRLAGRPRIPHLRRR